MTSYSVLGSGSRTVVVATWSGEQCDQSTKITTLDRHEGAERLAWMLTRLSEDAWDAAAFLDTYPLLEDGIGQLCTLLRDPNPVVPAVALASAEGLRHTSAGSHTDLVRLLTNDLPDVLNGLTRTQRLSFADEIATDAGARAQALELLPYGHDPEASGSRIWQMCEVTRSIHNGAEGPLPEGAANWIVQAWGTDGSPARRWGCREQLVRLDQLHAACLANGGRGDTYDDPFEAHLVFGQPGDKDTRIYWVHPTQKSRGRWASDPFKPLVVEGSDGHSPSRVLGEVTATDDNGFAALLGDWVRTVPYLRPTDTYVDPTVFD
ncbi:hypothetical protein RB614_24375 [Phytohabitans sp. ZYX-F-186]|uniref:HEAT repeat domain-containing protein n=1 Tax=Phytohabitans maris TaxID=3071409 RepID=A0ABU0ZKT4_9ACTN|nr:hypothetical protein [Phytohabitans sp. ZYX-F-186]MDQ7907662.1 hypothetical protein [Phytohabitans sp. ZYX-F-186]